MKQNLILLKQKGEKLSELEERYSNLKEQFKESNSVLIEEINQILNSFNETKEEIKIEAIGEFKINGEKKLLGGIGIRISKKLDYSEENALDWAVDNMPIAIKTILDKKQFESFAKTNDLEFVKKEESISVTFPKEIKL